MAYVVAVDICGTFTEYGTFCHDAHSARDSDS